MNLKVMSLTAGIMNTEKRQSAAAQNRIAPALRLVVSVMAILLCAISRNAFFTGCVIAVELLRTAMMSAESIRGILKKTVLPVLFTGLIMIPAVFFGSPGTFGTVTMKVFESVLVLSILNEDTAWSEMTGALSHLHVPQLFIMTLDTTVRFLVVLGRYSNRLLEAVNLRRVGKKNWKNAGTGGVLGVTWLKSQQMLRANSEAMTCRCFNGIYRKNFRFEEENGQMRKKRILRNVLYAMIIPFILWGFWYTQRLM